MSWALPGPGGWGDPGGGWGGADQGKTSRRWGGADGRFRGKGKGTLEGAGDKEEGAVEPGALRTWTKDGRLEGGQASPHPSPPLATPPLHLGCQPLTQGSPSPDPSPSPSLLAPTHPPETGPFLSLRDLFFSPALRGGSPAPFPCRVPPW